MKAMAALVLITLLAAGCGDALPAAPTAAAMPTPATGPTIVPSEPTMPGDSPPASPTPARTFGLVTLGDSLTSGPSSWPEDLVREDAHLVLLHNAGVGGDTTGQMLSRFDSDVLPYHADLVITLGGSNDLDQHLPQAAILANLQAIVRLVKMSGGRPVLLTVPPSSDPAWVVRAQALNAGIVELGIQEGIPVVDAYDPVAGADGTYRPEMTTDGVHMTPAGYQAVAEAVSRAIAALGL